jgi:NDP-sugar pyrophosphorylase family protein
MTVGDFQAVLMAGGRGTRLFPYTAVLPKPLLPVGDKPVLELLLLHLRRHGICSIVIAVNHLRHLIQSFFGDGSALDMHIEYAVEDSPLGTCGPIGAVLDRMQPNFLLMNGDLLTDVDVTMFLAEHDATNATATVAGARRFQQIEYGVLDMNAAGKLLGYREKPRTEWIVSMGMYALRRDSLRAFVAPGKPLDMPDLLLSLIATGHEVRAWQTDCLWLDIGRPDEYARAQALAEGAASGQRLASDHRADPRVNIR